MQLTLILRTGVRSVKCNFGLKLIIWKLVLTFILNLIILNIRVLFSIIRILITKLAGWNFNELWLFILMKLIEMPKLNLNLLILRTLLSTKWLSAWRLRLQKTVYFIVRLFWKGQGFFEGYFSSIILFSSWLVFHLKRYQLLFYFTTIIFSCWTLYRILIICIWWEVT